MQDLLTLPDPFLRAVVPALTLRCPIDVPLTTLQTADGVDFLAPLDPSRIGIVDRRHPWLTLSRQPDRERGVPFTHWNGLPHAVRDVPRVHLFVFGDGSCSGAVMRNGRASPLHAVHAPGPRFVRIEPGWPEAPLGGVPGRGTFSRLTGALGGRGPQRRLRRLAVAVIGVSRLGSLLAISLAKEGVGRLVLADADVVERHHLPAMDVPDLAAVGQAKVESTARMVRAVAPWTDVVPIAADLEDPRAVLACAGAELLIAAPDRGRPRLLAGMLAKAGHRVLLDIGTGVFGGAPQERFGAGCDVRLLLPGDPCLLCAGGVNLAAPEAVDFRRQRAGSLRSLNQIAVGFALFLLERLLVGDLRTSVWWRLQLGRAGELLPRAMPMRRQPGCSLCGLAGVGDAVWELAGR